MAPTVSQSNVLRTPLRWWLSAALSLGLILLAAFLLYLPALSGSFHFDDAPNLVGLASITDLHSALAFVFGGQAGPLGRSVALASFLPQLDAWPDHPESFLLANVLIHLINGVLVATLTYHLARALNDRIQHPWLFALVASLLWLIQPINASASLMVVQRMTTLSALFTLAGLLAYTLGRIKLLENPRSGLLLMTFGIAICTPLAALAKENGALLPVYALVLEATLLRGLGVSIPRLFQAWRYLFFGLPAVLIAGYLVYRIPSLSYDTPPFGVYERVTTQAYALVDYLRILLTPTPLAITPFYDNYAAVGDRIPSLVGSGLLIAWITAAVIAIWQRRRAPVLSFSVLWFLAGHTLESTFLPLELFYLHRNYLPSFSFVFLIAFFFLARPIPIRTPARLLLAPYMVLMALVLFETTSTWGKPDLAGELWLLDRPSSIRAAEFLAERYRQRDDERVANKIMRESFRENPNDTGSALEFMRTHCADGDSTARDAVLWRTVEVMQDGAFSKRTTQKLDSLVAAWNRGSCPLLNRDALHRLLDGLFANEQFARSSLQTHNLRLIRFRLHYSARAFEPAVSNLKAAYEIHPNNDTLRLLVEVLLAGGLHHDALEIINHATPPRTINPVRAQVWRDQIDEIKALIRQTP